MAAGPKLDSLISESRLRELAGDRYFERGERYFRNGAVINVRRRGDGIAARVIGTEPYVARMWLAGRALRWGCSCPLGVEGAFCKHLVATGLAWRSGKTGSAPEAVTELQLARDNLRAFDREALADLVADRAVWDEAFYEELLLAARALGDTCKRPAQKRKSTIKK